MGELLVRASAALQAVLGCTKTYTMLFAEAAGFAHLHIHVVPRMPTFTDDDIGPKAFHFLGRPDGERVGDEEQDRLSLELGTHISTGAWSS
jgi:diadenosine tetraphosphate (Ap4A) HIT family hydrolase